MTENVFILHHNIYKVSIVQVLQFSHAWIHRNGFILLNAWKSKIKSLRFILKPSEPNGTILQFNKEEKLYLENSILQMTNIKFDGLTVVNLTDYNIIELNLDKEKYISINNKKIKLLNGAKPNMERQIYIGNSHNGFTGGIQDILINDE